MYVLISENMTIESYAENTIRRLRQRAVIYKIYSRAAYNSNLQSVIFTSKIELNWIFSNHTQLLTLTIEIFLRFLSALHTQLRYCVLSKCKCMHST